MEKHSFGDLIVQPEREQSVIPEEIAEAMLSVQQAVWGSPQGCVGMGLVEDGPQFRGKERKGLICS